LKKELSDTDSLRCLLTGPQYRLALISESSLYKLIARSDDKKPSSGYGAIHYENKRVFELNGVTLKCHGLLPQYEGTGRRSQPAGNSPPSNPLRRLPAPSQRRSGATSRGITANKPT
jgi:hypothetical protein